MVTINKRKYYSLEDTPFIFTINTNDGELILYFSREFYLKKYENNWVKYLEDNTNYLNSLLYTKTEFKTFLLISLYRKIEKRGFKVQFRGELIKWQQIKLDGKIMILKN